MSQPTFEVELTYEEALVLALAACSGVSRHQGGLSSVIKNIGTALLRADPTLQGAQFDYWKKHGEPSYHITDPLPRLDMDGNIEAPL